MNFHRTYCVIYESVKNELKGVGKAVSGLYYLINQPVSVVIKERESEIKGERSTVKEKKAKIAQQ